MEGRSKIALNRDRESNSKFVFADDTYEIATEDLGIKKCKIVTRIYLRGEILFSTTSDYADFVTIPDLRDKLRSMIENSTTP